MPLIQCIIKILFYRKTNEQGRREACKNKRSKFCLVLFWTNIYLSGELTFVDITGRAFSLRLPQIRAKNRKKLLDIVSQQQQQQQKIKDNNKE